MNNIILISTLSMAGLGLFFASVLALANQKLKVEEDPMIEKILHELPGINCGACGFASCRQYAEALAKKKAPPDKCKASGEEQKRDLAKLLGVSLKTKSKEVAVVHCGADNSVRKKKASYNGVETCLAAHNTFGGELLCDWGCLGYGDCARACPFGAVTMVNGLPEIDITRCTACGKCVEACPRKIISIMKIENSKPLYVACSSRDKGPATRKTCQAGCIACGICEKLTEGAFSVKNNLSRVNEEKISGIRNREEVLKKCPTKCIKEV